MNSSSKLLVAAALALLPVCSQGAAPSIVIIVVDDLDYADPTVR